MYPAMAFISIIIFSCVHLWAEKMKDLKLASKSRFLSTGSGIAIAYVFVDLLPKLSESDQLVKEKLWGLFPYFEHHVYVMALIGFILFFVVDRSKVLIQDQSAFFWLSLSSYALFNFLVGYAVVDKDNLEVQPLVLFTIAMGLHYFVNDYSLSDAHGSAYRTLGKWILIASLGLGWLVGFLTELPETAVALVSAFIGGGVIMNVTRHELPEENPHSLSAFLIAAAAYTAVLLTIGTKS